MENAEDNAMIVNEENIQDNEGNYPHCNNQTYYR